MNKTVKGASAASTAAVLLLGGAGTLAYWNDVDTVAGTSFTAGQLDLNAANCAAAGWTVSNAIEGVTNAAFVPGTDKVVPGDTLTKTCTIAITAVGKNLRANLNATAPTSNGSTMAAADYNLSATFKRGGQTISSVTDDDVNKTIDVAFTLAFPIKAVVDNNSQLKNVNVDAVAVTATQATTAVTP